MGHWLAPPGDVATVTATTLFHRCLNNDDACTLTPDRTIVRCNTDAGYDGILCMRLSDARVRRIHGEMGILGKVHVAVNT